MFCHGNFALISPPSLIQILCQEGRSVVVRAYRGSSRAHLALFEGLIVDAQHDELSGPEAFYQLAFWNEGLFAIEPLSEPPGNATMAASWESLLLEAARRRDELELHTNGQSESLPFSLIDQLLNDCPACSGLALVGRDGRLIATAGISEELVQWMCGPLAGLMALAKPVEGVCPTTLMLDDGTLCMVVFDNLQRLFFGVVRKGVPLAEARRQLARAALTAETA